MDSFCSFGLINAAKHFAFSFGKGDMMSSHFISNYMGNKRRIFCLPYSLNNFKLFNILSLWFYEKEKLN